MVCYQTSAWQKLNCVTSCSVALWVSTGTDWEQHLQGLPWAESDKTIDLEVNEPSSLDLLLKFYLYIKGSCCSHSYLLCTCSVCHWSLLLPLTLIFPLFQCFLLHSLPRSWFSLLSSLLAVFVSQNVQDRHNRRGYNVENLEISIVVFFSF